MGRTEANVLVQRPWPRYVRQTTALSLPYILLQVLKAAEILVKSPLLRLGKPEK